MTDVHNAIAEPAFVEQLEVGAGRSALEEARDRLSRRTTVEGAEERRHICGSAGSRYAPVRRHDRGPSLGALGFWRAAKVRIHDAVIECVQSISGPVVDENVDARAIRQRTGQSVGRWRPHAVSGDVIEWIEAALIATRHAPALRSGNELRRVEERRRAGSKNSRRGLFPRT
jgi:hypothetical protein